MIHFGTFTNPSGLAADTFYLPGYQLADNSGSYVLVPMVPNTSLTIDASGNPTFATASQRASQLSAFFDAAGTAAAAVSALNTAAPQTVAALAAINAELENDESAAAALTSAVAAKLPLTDPRLVVHSFTQNLGTVAQISGHFSVTGLSGLSAFSKVRAWQSDVPVLGTLSDFLEMDQIQISASIANNTTLNFFWVATGQMLGSFNFNWQLAA